MGTVFKARFATPFAKQTGLQKPLNVSDTLAKIIGTKKGEQVCRPRVVKKLWA